MMTPQQRGGSSLDRICQVRRLGLADYLEVMELQCRLVTERAAGCLADTLLLLEHPPTYTLGATGDEAHLLVSREFLARRGVVVHRVNRGGDITYHGPGQLVGYPILNIGSRRGGPLRYLRDLEETLMSALREFGVDAARLRHHTGVWVGGEKIAAIGVKVSAHHITSHGFALNVNPDLDWFRRIIPCGIRDKGVTSLERVLGQPVGMDAVAEQVVAAFGRVFDCTMVAMCGLDGVNRIRPSDLRGERL
jgi:lipoyl(octanoyl) transferase